jgi:hypothetical protein
MNNPSNGSGMGLLARWPTTTDDFVQAIRNQID